MKKKFFNLEQSGTTAQLNIYGDITSWPWESLGEVSANNLAKQLDELDVDEIKVFINSYGGEVAEGLAIYNALKRHKAKITTVVDGFACSIASVIFMAGDTRIMNDSSLLMIHNAWQNATGNSDDLRKAADDLDKINASIVKAYDNHSTLSEKEIKKLMKNETWILPEEALEYGFATEIEDSEEEQISASVRTKFLNMFKANTEPIEPEPVEPVAEPSAEPIAEPITEPAEPAESKNLFSTLVNVLK